MEPESLVLLILLLTGAAVPGVTGPGHHSETNTTHVAVDTGESRKGFIQPLVLIILVGFSLVFTLLIYYRQKLGITPSQTVDVEAYRSGGDEPEDTGEED